MQNKLGWLPVSYMVHKYQSVLTMVDLHYLDEGVLFSPPSVNILPNYIDVHHGLQAFSLYSSIYNSSMVSQLQHAYKYNHTKLKLIKSSQAAGAKIDHYKNSNVIK